MDGLTYCTDIGFTQDAVATVQERAREALVQSAVKSAGVKATRASGDMSLGSHLAQLARLTPKQLKKYQDDQIAGARDAVGRLKLVDYLDRGRPIPVGFFDKYPQLGVDEGSEQAKALRAGKPMPIAAAAGSVEASAVSPYPESDYYSIMPGVAQKQANSWYCGPATMKMMDLGDDGSAAVQGTWASRMGTTQEDGTWIGGMTAGMNKYTTWDDKAGDYAVVSVADRTKSWFLWIHRTRVGFTESPIVEHVSLKRSYFTYINRDHGGHYQVGRGYDSQPAEETIGIIEPYNEADFWADGADSAGYHKVALEKMWGATLANVNQNIGY